MNILAIFPSNMRKFGGALNANFGSIASGTLNAFFFFFLWREALCKVRDSWSKIDGHVR